MGIHSPSESSRTNDALPPLPPPCGCSTSLSMTVVTRPPGLRTVLTDGKRAPRCTAASTAAASAGWPPRAASPAPEKDGTRTRPVGPDASKVTETRCEQTWREGCSGGAETSSPAHDKQKWAGGGTGAAAAAESDPDSTGALPEAAASTLNRPPFVPKPRVGGAATLAVPDGGEEEAGPVAASRGDKTAVREGLIPPSGSPPSAAAGHSGKASRTSSPRDTLSLAVLLLLLPQLRRRGSRLRGPGASPERACGRGVVESPLLPLPGGGAAASRP